MIKKARQIIEVCNVSKQYGNKGDTLITVLNNVKWCAERGMAELWGLDISDRQLENAKEHLAQNGYGTKLFRSPMEQNPELPIDYFDVVYSIYTVDLQETFQLISSYLKQGGIFIFSWDHPFMHCVDEIDGKLVFSGSYFESEHFTFQNGSAILN